MMLEVARNTDNVCYSSFILIRAFFYIDETGSEMQRKIILRIVNAIFATAAAHKWIEGVYRMRTSVAFDIKITSYLDEKTRKYNNFPT